MEENEDILDDRGKIRANLSTMSFEELQKLKEEIGEKLYNETIFGEKRRKKVKTDFKRENKNRPREMSSKKPVYIQKNNVSVKSHVPRDPRFDPLCGTFDEREFKKSYKFLHKVKYNERQALKEELEETTDPKRKKQIQYLIQRIDNQIREKEKKEKEQEKIIEEKREMKMQLKKGEKPVYQKKSEKKMMNLLTKYEELKESKKLHKHIEKKSKKLARKDFKKVNNYN